ncbi:DUF1571 domain-containing protein [Tautonia marina]|uniref:DUF1571 domain-containing protein n=1 Tax=Tautonia marina TaxID=2653855 RepID=UPI001375DE44|nr:DUF1571 domain-containing protein [Tautonia marina]
MTSGQHWSEIRRHGSPRRALTAVVLIMVSGCAPFQKTWGPRFGEHRLAPAHEHAPPVEHGTGLSDSYASRLNRTPPPIVPNGIPTPEPLSPPGSGFVPIATPVPAPSPPELEDHLTDRSDPPIDPKGVEPHSTLVSRPPEDEVSEPPDDLDAIDRVMDLGIARLTSIQNYRVTLDRQERVRDSLQPAEQVVLNVRTEPFAVRLEWPDGPNRGREVLYSETECNGMMHIKLGKTLIPVPPMQLEPSSPLALSNSRHPITEAGLLHILTQTKEQVDRVRSGDPSLGNFTLEGPHVPDDFEVTCLEVLRRTPEGEFWRLVVDQASSLPLLLEATAPDGQLLERYHFQDIQTDLEELAASDAFDPAVRFGRPIALPIDRLATGQPE